MEAIKFNDQEQNIYWANKEGTDFITEAMSKVEDYHQFLIDSNLYWMWARSYVAYYGANLTNNELGKMFAGIKMDVENKTVRAKINHYRNLMKHALQLITSQKAALSCRSSNTDMKSQTQTILGAGLVDFYIREKTYGKHFSKAAEYGLILSEGWIHSPWRKDIGDPYDVDEDGKTIYQGDVDPRVLSPLSIIRDVSLEHDQQQWRIVEEYENKWDLAVEYASNDKDLWDHIVNSTNDSADSASGMVERFSWYLCQTRNQTSDDRIKTYTFYHDKSPAVPEGRVVKFIDGAMLKDNKMPYKRMPLSVVKPDEILESPFGYTPAFELLGPQQGIDALSSAAMTNVITFAKQKIWTKTGDDIIPSDLDDDIIHLQSNEMPQALNLTKTSPELYKLLEYYEGSAEVLSGISSTVRGKPEASLSSGAALALVVSQSIQYASMYERSQSEMIEKEGTDLIDKLRIFAKTPRVASILGESSRPFQKEFTADDLSEINRVVVEQQNPLSKTTAGKIQLADALLAKNMIEDPKQYIMVATTGQLDPAIQNTQFELLSIRAENEEMRRGGDILAVITENHIAHIKEHRSLIENPEAKKDPEALERVFAHIQQHINLWYSMSPALLMITGQNPPPPGPIQMNGGAMPPQMGGMPQQMGGVPPQMGGGGSNQAQAADVFNQGNSGPVPDDMMPNMPNMPKNPLSGEEFNNETGGL